MDAMEGVGIVEWFGFNFYNKGKKMADFFKDKLKNQSKYKQLKGGTKNFFDFL